MAELEGVASHKGVCHLFWRPEEGSVSDGGCSLWSGGLTYSLEVVILQVEPDH